MTMTYNEIAKIAKKKLQAHVIQIRWKFIFYIKHLSIYHCINQILLPFVALAEVCLSAVLTAGEPVSLDDDQKDQYLLEGDGLCYSGNYGGLHQDKSKPFQIDFY